MCRSKPWARDCQATGTSCQRRNSHAAAAIDLLAATPPISATTLTAALAVAVKTAVRPLDGLIAVGIAVEVTRRSMRRLFRLKGLERLAKTVRPPHRPIVARAEPDVVAEPRGATPAARRSSVAPFGWASSLA